MNSKILFIVRFLFHFIAVTPLASLSHDHEIDGEYHDNCPACRWEVQALGDDPQTNTVFIDLVNPFYQSGRHYVIRLILLKDQSILTADHSRAPPSMP